MKRKAVLSLLLLSTVSQTYTFVAPALFSTAMTSIAAITLLDHRIQKTRSVNNLPRRSASLEELGSEAKLIGQETKNKWDNFETKWNEWFPNTSKENETTDAGKDNPEDVDTSIILG